MSARHSSAKPGFFRSLWRVTRQVFHESTGALFLVMGLMWSAAAVRQWTRGTPAWTWVSLGCFALMMLVFGWTSFRAAKRVR